MAGPLAAVERFFERLFERPAARIFQAHVEPVHIQRGLERAMKSERRMVQAPHLCAEHVPGAAQHRDYTALDDDRAALTRDLSESLRISRAVTATSCLPGRRVEIGGSASVPPGDVRVYAQPVVPPLGSTGSRSPPTARCRAAGPTHQRRRPRRWPGPGHGRVRGTFIEHAACPARNSCAGQER